jgi:hypothetical protein
MQHLLTITIIILSLGLCYGIGYYLTYPTPNGEQSIISKIILGFATMVATAMLIGLCFLIYTMVYDALIHFNITI